MGQAFGQGGECDRGAGQCFLGAFSRGVSASLMTAGIEPSYAGHTSSEELAQCQTACALQGSEAQVADAEQDCPFVNGCVMNGEDYTAQIIGSELVFVISDERGTRCGQQGRCMARVLDEAFNGMIASPGTKVRGNNG